MSKELSEFEAYKQIQSLFGEDSVFGDMDEVPKVDIIRTPSPSLDRAIGVGGWPRGRLIQLAGKESSGKTMITLSTIADYQKLDPENCALFLDAEFTYDKSWAAKLGVDNNRVILIKTNEAQRIFQGLVGQSKVNKTTGKATKVAGIFDMIANKQVAAFKNAAGSVKKFNLGKLGVIVLDSIASLQTPAEVVADVGKNHMAQMARFMSNELKKITPGLAASNAIMLAINQVRVDPGKMFGNPEGTPGGKALKHACSLMIELAPLSGADNILHDSGKNMVGRKVFAKISKNKVSSPHKRADYFINFTEGVVRKAEEILEVGCKCGAIEMASARTYVILGEKATSKQAAIELIEKNLSVVEEMVREHYLNNDTSVAMEVDPNDNDDVDFDAEYEE